MASMAGGDPEVVLDDQLSEPPLLGHPPHQHQVVADGAVGADQVDDPLVDVGRQPAVELDLPMAHRLACRTGREVGEREVHRLLQLVDVVPHEDHDRDVGLHQGCSHAAILAGRALVREGPSSLSSLLQRAHHRRVSIERASAADLAQRACDVGPLPTQVGALLVLDRADRLDPSDVRAAVRRRLRDVPRLHQHLVDAPLGCGRPYWTEDPTEGWTETRPPRQRGRLSRAG